jgi:hypothetical protein
MTRKAIPVRKTSRQSCSCVARERDLHSTACPYARAMRVISTGTMPDRHIVASNGPYLLGRLLCGRLIGGPFVGEGVEENLVDCIGCLDVYAERLRAARGLPPVANADAGLTG